jgi:hypothetical protein
MDGARQDHEFRDARLRFNTPRLGCVYLGKISTKFVCPNRIYGTGNRPISRESAVVSKILVRYHGNFFHEVMNDAIGIDHLTRNPAGLAIVSESGDPDLNGIHYLWRTVFIRPSAYQES